ncbi:MAG: response regulator transcription factor [Alphaproteobacteria bacterium]|nr:response regulator transcription factor [Alphaproteobacteria bacterium]
MRILLVEDDATLAAGLSKALAAEGFAVDVAEDGDIGCYMGETQDYDAVVLDLGLPKLPGLEVLKRWRAKGRLMPVLVLTARGTWTERVAGLNAGADDYLGKPFEVIARLRALIRRSGGVADSVLRHGDIVLDPATGVLTVAGETVEVTAFELRVLTYLMHRAGRIVSQAELLDHIYPGETVREINTIEVYIGRLRKKIGREVIRTVRGLGYRLG